MGLQLGKDCGRLWMVKRSTLVFVTGVIMMISLACGVLELMARYKEAEWLDFIQHWENKGESFSTESLLPETYPATEQFISHPWIHSIATGEPEVSRRLAELDPERIPGYREWLRNAGESDDPVPMPSDLARQILARGAEASPDLDALADAAARPGSRLANAAEVEAFQMPDWVAQLANVKKLLGAMAEAAIALDDAEAFTRSVEILLLTGCKLRDSNDALAAVVGAGFERDAYDVLMKIPKGAMVAQRKRLLTGLDLRTRPLTEEFGATVRVERARGLALLKKVSRGRPKGIPSPGSSYVRLQVTRARLLACEPLQTQVLASGGNLKVPLTTERIERFCDHTRTWKAGSMEMIGTVPIWGYCRLYSTFMGQEEQRLETRVWVRGE